MNWWQMIIFGASLCVLGFTAYVIAKNLRKSIAVIAAIILGIIYVPIRILAFFIDLIIAIIKLMIPGNVDKLQTKIAYEYDKCFFEAGSIKAVAKEQSKIEGLQKKLYNITEKQKEKQMLKLLDEAKWVL